MGWLLLDDGDTDKLKHSFKIGAIMNSTSIAPWTVRFKKGLYLLFYKDLLKSKKKNITKCTQNNKIVSIIFSYNSNESVDQSRILFNTV